MEPIIKKPSGSAEPPPNKFAPQGKEKVITGSSIVNPYSGSLGLVLLASSIDGKPESKVYNLLSKKWPKVTAELKGWHQSQINWKLGAIQSTACQSDVWCMHMLCLDKDRNLDENALENCLLKVKTEAISNKASIHVSSLLVEDIPILPKMLQPFLERGINLFLYEEHIK